MEATIDQVREVTTSLAPIKSKLDAGDTSLTAQEASDFSRAFDMWNGYLDTH